MPATSNSSALQKHDPLACTASFRNHNLMTSNPALTATRLAAGNLNKTFTASKGVDWISAGSHWCTNNVSDLPTLI